MKKEEIEKYANYYHDRLNDYIGHPTALRELIVKVYEEARDEWLEEQISSLESEISHRALIDKYIKELNKK